MLACQAAHRLPIHERVGDLLVAIGIMVEHPASHPDRRVRQRVANRLRMFALLDKVASLEYRGDLIEGHRLLVSPSRYKGDRQPLDEPLRRRKTAAEDRGQYHRREGPEQ